MAYDRNLLAFKNIEDFKRWLDDNQLAWRPGKGQHQVLQIKLKDSWTAVSVSERNAVTTSPALREMIQRFNKGMPYTGKTPRIDQDKAVVLAPDSDQAKAEAAQAGQAQFLEDLRDDIAMHALQGLLAYTGDESRGNYHTNSTPADTAEMAYRYADAMLEARKA